MIKKDAYTFRGVSQDTTKSKHQKEYYYEGNNIRITATDSQSTGSVTNEKGNELALTIPTPSIDHTTAIISYGNKRLRYTKTKDNEIDTLYTGKTSGQQNIIGDIVARDNIILFTTDDKGFDCIWKVDENNDIELLYIRDMGFSINNPIQSIFNYENDNIEKVYWVDGGKSQLRFINYKQSKDRGDVIDLIDIPVSSINSVGNFNVSQPYVSSISYGGTHTSGRIQYAYNLYSLNGAQTRISPLSELVSLTKGNNMGGGKVNESVGASPTVKIEDIDGGYSHIKVYAIKYTSYNQVPTVSLIEDRALPSPNFNGEINVEVFDDGNVLHDISLSEFLFLGSGVVKPKHILAKDNRMYLANITEENFDVDLDTRAYSFSLTANPRVHQEIKVSNGSIVKTTGLEIKPPLYTLSEKHPAINGDYDTFRYQADNSTEGGEGRYIKYELQKIQATDTRLDSFRVFKDNEIYRIGIQFYNKLGQVSFPKWIADFRAPEGNLEGTLNTLKVTFKSEFYEWLNTSSNFKSDNDVPVGYKIIRADRTARDRTVMGQGLLNGMMSNFKATTKCDSDSSAEARKRHKAGDKLPSLLRPFDESYTQLRAMKDGTNLCLTKSGNLPSENYMVEANRATSQSQNGVAETFQFNKLIQLFSPDAMFGSLSLDQGLTLKVKGANKNLTDNLWARDINTDRLTAYEEAKFLGGISNWDSGVTKQSIIGSTENIANYGIYGPVTESKDKFMAFYQFYRNYTGGFVKSPNKAQVQVYGRPELTERGQGATNYNGDGNFRYYNTLLPMMADGGDEQGSNSPSITSVNSFGAKCLTLVLGNGDFSGISGRIPLEDLYGMTGLTDTNVVLIAELIKSDPEIYAGNIYGGNSYEDKKRTNYIEIGKYTSINSGDTTSSINIDSPGDTFVQPYKFLKIGKSDTETYKPTSVQITEIVETIVESTIDLKNRSDVSNHDWDSSFHPRYNEYHDYNRVYSQNSTLIENQDADYTFKKVNKFDTKIMTTKVKVPGENIDAWTDLLENETLALDGSYGPINSMSKLRDTVVVLQDSALAHIAINPRVQVQDTEGIGIELGTGKALHDYKYLSTNSGTLNKWGVVSTQYGLYYLDTLNKTFMRYTGKLEKLSDTHGLHTWFQNNIDYNVIKEDNPLIGKGVHLGYDLINNSVMLTCNQGINSVTRVFSEATNTFIGLMDYTPSRYISTAGKLFMTNNNLNLYEHFKGDYNHFFGTYYPSYITLLVNPATNYHCVFDNIEFNSELYLDDIDQADKTLSHIQAWNEYQDSGKIPLVIGRNSNLRRKFRTWRANIPRDGRNRMRNPWIFLKLELDNTNNYKLILHDIIVSYTIS